MFKVTQTMTTRDGQPFRNESWSFATFREANAYARLRAEVSAKHITASMTTWRVSVHLA